MPSNNILDTLTGLGKTVIDCPEEGLEVTVPDKCISCKNNVLCSLIPTFANMSSIGVVLNIKKCPYYSEILKK
jgi:hypothetical protein